MKLDKVKQECRSKDEFLRESRENFQYLEDKFKAKDQICRSQQENLKEVGRQLESKTELCKQMEKQFLQLSQGMRDKEDICSSLQQQVGLQEEMLFPLVILPYTYLNLIDYLISAKVNELQDKLRECEEVGSKTLQHKVFAARTRSSVLC